MNTNSESQRGLVDFILFGIAFVGFVIMAAGVVITIVPGAITGLILMFVSLVGFWLKGE